ncbi:MAG: AmmeMemoRadiSam system radical SAM enzyme [Thermoplasmatota archaeon]
MTSRMKARYWESSDNGRIICSLCPRRCRIENGARGVCGIRENRGGILYALAYGIYPAVHRDPIEKKPLNHFLPGSDILSIGSVGCNLTCLHCQNWSLSRERIDGKEPYYLPPDDLVRNAVSGGSIGVAFTYNEPSINIEYLLEVTPDLRKSGARTVLVTNGYLMPEPWRELMVTTDAANIDVKAFTEEFYKTVTGGSLAPVLENVKTAYEMEVHIELTYLVIPGYNDDRSEINDYLEWVRDELSPEVPLHFSRFHPDFKMNDVRATPMDTLLRIRDQCIKAGMKHVYIGNVMEKGLDDTICPSCGRTIIRRSGYRIDDRGMRGNGCRNCGRMIRGVF